jgi:hypothetical protein
MPATYPGCIDLASARYVYNAYPHCIQCVSIVYPWCIHETPRVSLAPSQVSRGVINSRPLYPWCIRDVSIVYPALVQRSAFPCVRVMRAAQPIVHPPCIHVVSTLHPPARRPMCVQGAPKVYPVHFPARGLGSLPPDQRARNVVFLLGRSDAPSVGVSLGCASGCCQDVLRTLPSVALSVDRLRLLFSLGVRVSACIHRVSSLYPGCTQAPHAVFSAISVSIVYPVCIQCVYIVLLTRAPHARPLFIQRVSSVYPCCIHGVSWMRPWCRWRLPKCPAA